jgi:hypothetical protein
MSRSQLLAAVGDLLDCRLRSMQLGGPASPTAVAKAA